MVALVHLFGLTGGIASGKSTAAARLRARHVPVIDADSLAREVVAPGTEGLAAIVEAFGRDILDPNGALDRKKLGRIAFGDEAARLRLNAITHGRIAERARQRAASLRDSGEPLACYEAALLVENGLADAFRPLLVVACPEEVQIARIRARDDLSESEARDRVRAQKPLAEKIAVADFVIDTAGPVEATCLATDNALRAICARTGVDPSRYFSSSSA
jgi:dephospho-CoA kinase